MNRRTCAPLLGPPRCWTAFIVGLLCLSAHPTEAAFNEIIAGARPQAMGAAFVAVADDSNALFWNPAGLPQLGTAEASFMHANEFDISVGPELTTDFVGFVNWPMTMGVFGFSAYRQGAQEILQETTLNLSYGAPVSPVGSLGLNFKYLEIEGAGRQVNPNDPAIGKQDTFSLDLGGLFWITPSWRVGFLARNLIGKLGAGELEELEKTYRFGSAYHFEDILFLNDRLIWSTDLFTRRDIDDEAGTKVRVASGFEYTVDDRFSFRIGANKGDLTVGLGFGHPEAGVFIDYAFADDDLGKTHRISATYRFGAPPNEIHVVHHPPPDPPKSELDEDTYPTPGERPQGPGREPSRSSRSVEEQAWGTEPVAPSDRSDREFNKELRQFLDQPR